MNYVLGTGAQMRSANCYPLRRVHKIGRPIEPVKRLNRSCLTGLWILDPGTMSGALSGTILVVSYTGCQIQFKLDVPFGNGVECYIFMYRAVNRIL